MHETSPTADGQPPKTRNNALDNFLRGAARLMALSPNSVPRRRSLVAARIAAASEDLLPEPLAGGAAGHDGRTDTMVMPNPNEFDEEVQ